MTTENVSKYFLGVLFLLMAISSSASASVNISPSVKRQLTAKLIEQHIDKKLNAIDHDTVSNALAAGTVMACSQLGELALIDLEPTTKSTALVADGTCWFAYFSIKLGSYFIAQISAATSAQQRQINVKKVHPYIYDDGVSRITSVPIGDSFQITRTGEYLHDSFIVKPTNEYYQYAKTLAQHRSRSQEKKAFQQIKKLFANKNKFMAEEFCFEPNPSKKRRQLPLHEYAYCLPTLPLVSRHSIQPGNMSIEIDGYTSYFNIDYLRDSSNTPYGGFNVHYTHHPSARFNHQYSSLLVDGLLLDTANNTLLPFGSEITFGRRYGVINIYQLTVDRRHELTVEYLNQVGLFNLFTRELDNTSYFEMSGYNNIVFFYMTIDNLSTFLPQVFANNLTERSNLHQLIKYYAVTYFHHGDSSLNRRQLILLNGLSLLLEGLNPLLENETRDLIDSLLKDLSITRPEDENYDIPINIDIVQNRKTVYSNRDLYDFIKEILNEIAD